LNIGQKLFAIPGHIYSEHYQGCHQLIREGAILIDHPQQVIEELALATQWQALENIAKTKVTEATSQQIPPHLLSLYNQLDWVGQTLDQLGMQVQQEVSSLTSQLMELELLGFCTQQAGLYLRCRILK
jgi:DNA processing protein